MRLRSGIIVGVVGLLVLLLAAGAFELVRLLQFATARIGVVLVTINPAYQAAELEYTLAQSEVRGLALIDRFRSARG